jgi:hypothetical protein
VPDLLGLSQLLLVVDQLVDELTAATAPVAGSLDQSVGDVAGATALPRGRSPRQARPGRTRRSAGAAWKLAIFSFVLASLTLWHDNVTGSARLLLEMPRAAVGHTFGGDAVMMRIGELLGLVYFGFLTVWIWATRRRWNGKS